MQSSATEYLVHGPRSYVDYDRSWGNSGLIPSARLGTGDTAKANAQFSGRQLLVSDTTANILSNFLAVFLALAAKNLYIIVRRGFIKPTQDLPDAPATDEQDGAERIVLTARANILARTNTSAGGSDGGTVEASQEAPNNLGNPEASSVDTVSQINGYGNDVAPAHASPHNPERLDNLENSDDAETAMLKYFRSFWSGLKQMIPIHAFGNDHSRFPRIFSGRFRIDMIRFFKDDSGNLLWHLFMGLAMLGLYMLVLLVGIISAYPIVGDSVALSRHPRCGLASYHESNPQDIPRFSKRQKYYHDIAMDSQQYAKTCYNAGNNVDSCSFFYEPSIKYLVKDNDSCPFNNESGHLCFAGPSSAFTLDTGAVDAKVIGINSPLRYTFRRNMTCAPLLMDKSLIRPFKDENNFTNFWYLYGKRTGENFSCTGEMLDCTFEVPVYPTFTSPYSMFVAGTRTYDPSIWQPIFDVNYDLGEVASLVLISNFGINYPSVTLDPIFFANTTFDGGNWYYNTRLHAGVLGCMTRTVVCPPDQTGCMSLEQLASLDRIDDEHAAVRDMLYFSLTMSDLEAQLAYLQAATLDAQSKLSGATSAKLTVKQWQVESQQFFETMLARIQINARNIARGTPGNDLPNQTNILPPESKGMCARYKFRSVGWTNISVWRFAAEFSAGVIVCLVACRRNNGELWIEKPLRHLVRSRVAKYIRRTIVGPVMGAMSAALACLFSAICRSAIGLGRGTYSLINWIRRTTGEAVDHLETSMTKSSRPGYLFARRSRMDSVAQVRRHD